MLCLVDEAEQPKELEKQEEDSRKKREAERIAEKERAERNRRDAAEYMETYKIPEVVNRLLVELLIQRPENPVKYCQQFFRTNPADLQTHDSVEVARKLSEPSVREYMIKARLPWLFEDLLNALLADRPTDPATWVLTWLHWKTTKYVK